MNLFTFFQHESSKMYYFLVGLLYIFYFITFLGIYYIKPEYTEYLSIFIRLFVSCILLLRFNPFYKATLTESDRILISSSALFLLLNTGITQLALHYFHKVKDDIIILDH